ncbi:hypothetical protein J2Z66_001368 [Paenibacillus eucommiae]|uniref:Uncharacterized protein n=1 Tax=Paenibacillus eucommiae TaxID=1355755 RepID=A0ABS4IRK6_9BACL|nr:hypothetical protein [Paenibacillus eucommiae]
MPDVLEEWIIEADINSMQTAMELGKIRSEDRPH